MCGIVLVDIIRDVRGGVGVGERGQVGEDFAFDAGGHYLAFQASKYSGISQDAFPLPLSKRTNAGYPRLGCLRGGGAGSENGWRDCMEERWCGAY